MHEHQITLPETRSAAPRIERCFALYLTSLAMSKLYRKLLHKPGLTYPQSLR